MFNTIRKKVNDAIQEGMLLSESLSTNLIVAKPFDTQHADLGIPSSIKVDAGANILQENEETWKHLHEANEINAEKAEDVDRNINQIKRKTERLYVDLTDLNLCLATIPDLEKSLRNCLAQVQGIQKQCISFEQKLVELEDLCEEVELQERQLQHRVQMSLYRQKKMGELENVRRKLAEHHDRSVQKFETELRKIQQERQAVFQDAFQHDLEVFKQQGSLPKVENVNLDKHRLSLEEIVLDDEEENKNELENFLNQ